MERFGSEHIGRRSIARAGARGVGLAVAFALSAVACGGSSGGAGAASGGGASASSTATGGAASAAGGAEGGGAADAGAGGVGGAGGDGDDDFAHAAPVTIGSLGADAVIQTPGDHDFFRFDATAGQWLRLFTSPSSFTSSDPLDTVLRLYGPNEELLATNDDNEAPYSHDAEIIFHVPEDGTYFAEVLDHAEFVGDLPRGDPTYGYALRVLEIDPALGGVVIDPEQGDDAASAAPTDVSIPTAAYDYGEILGTFRDAADVDVFSFDFHEAGFVDDLLVLAWGTAGDGSTSAVGRMWVTDPQGAVVHARLDVASTGLRDVSCRGLDAGLLWIEHPAAPLGPNDFYAAKLRSAPTDDEEAEAEDSAAPGSNDDDATAEPIALTDDGVGRTASFTMRLSAPGDVDCFAFPLEASDAPELACRSARWGSGVQGLHLEVHDPSGAVIASANETTGADAATPPFVAAAAGLFVACLTKASQDVEVVGDFVTCSLRIAD